MQTASLQLRLKMADSNNNRSQTTQSLDTSTQQTSESSQTFYNMHSMPSSQVSYVPTYSGQSSSSVTHLPTIASFYGRESFYTSGKS